MYRNLLALTAAGLFGAASAMAQTTSPPATQTQPPAPTAPPAAAPTTPPAGGQGAVTSPGPAKSSEAMPGRDKQSLATMPTRQMPGQRLASKMIGSGIQGANNERIGTVNDLLIDEGGKVVGMLVGVGGFLGIGEKTVAVPFDALSQAGDGTLTVQLSKSDLDGAPAFVTTSGTGTGTGGSAPGGGSPGTTSSSGPGGTKK